jgi:hypothetical protein
MQGSRRSDRKGVSFPATVSVAGRKVRDVVSNVSPTGLYLEADRHRFRAGERIRVSFSLPLTGRLVPVSVEGRVARVVRDALHRTKGIGVELIAPSETALEAIQQYVSTREAMLGPGQIRDEAVDSPEPVPPMGKVATDARLQDLDTAEYLFDEGDETTEPGL